MPSAAITAAERLTIMRILDLPDTVQVIRVDDRGLGLYTETLTNGYTPASTTITTYLAALTDSQIDSIRVLLTQWSAVEFSTVTVQAGQTGETSGVTFDPAATRDLVKQYMKQVVPFVRFDESMRQKMHNVGTSVIY